jgi:hypothetical protein
MTIAIKAKKILQLPKLKSFDHLAFANCNQDVRSRNVKLPSNAPCVKFLPICKTIRDNFATRKSRTLYPWHPWCYNFAHAGTLCSRQQKSKVSTVLSAGNYHKFKSWKAHHVATGIWA